MAGALKKTTGLTGLAVSKHPIAELQLVYNKILRFTSKLPQDYFYRRSVENMISERMNIMKENKDVAAVEEKIGHGQIEEMIVHAKDELTLVENMIRYKPWESLEEKAPAHQWTWPPRK